MLRLVGRRSIVGLALSLWAFLGPAVASAQDEGGEYHELITEAVSEFEAHRFEEARALFRRAHDLSPNARTLRGIGLTSFEMRDYVVAYRSLGAALVDERRALSETQRQEVGALVERSARFIGIFRLQLSPPSARVTVDGRPDELARDGTLLLELGAHQLVFAAAGHEPVERTLQVRGGEDEPLPVELPRADDAADLDHPEETPPVDTPRPPTPGPAPAPDLGPAIGLLVAGGALAVTSVIVGATWWGSQADQLSVCEQAGAGCVNRDELVGARDAAAGTTVAIAILGGAGLLIGAVLFATADSGPSGAARVDCAPAGAGVVCAGRF
jgi:hypothetical protein